MPRVSPTLLSILVSINGASANADTQDHSYSASISSYGKGYLVRFWSCTKDVTLLGYLDDLVLTSPKRQQSSGDCTLSTLQVEKDLSKDDYLVVRSANGTNLISMADIEPKDPRFSDEYSSVIVFVGGIIFATLSKILSSFFDPLFYTFNIIRKFGLTKKFFLSVADSFERDFEVSEDLQKAAKGEYISNWLLFPSRRSRIRKLLLNIEDWKARRIEPEEFRQRLKIA